MNKMNRQKDITLILELIEREMAYLEQFNLLKAYDRLQAFGALITLQEYFIEEGMEAAESE